MKIKIFIFILSFGIISTIFGQETDCHEETIDPECIDLVNVDPSKVGQIIYFNSAIDNEYNQERPINQRHIPLLTLVEHPFQDNYYQVKICYAHNPNQITPNGSDLVCNSLGAELEENVRYYSYEGIKEVFEVLKQEFLTEDIGSILLNGLLLPFAFTKVFKLGAAARGVQVAYQVGVDLAFFQLIGTKNLGNGNALDLNKLDGLMVLKTLNNIEINDFAGDIHNLLMGKTKYTFSGSRFVKKIISDFPCKDTPNLMCQDFEMDFIMQTNYSRGY